MRHPRTTRSTVRRGSVAALLCALAAPLLAQEIYKSVDAQGNVVYSDRGTSKNAPTTTLHVTEPDPAEAARLAKQQQLLLSAERQRQREQASAEKAQARSAHQQQASCDKARTKYFQMKDTGRLFQRDAQGNRVYYSDEEADALREKAHRAMVSACGG